MSRIFIEILNQSLSAVYLILAVLIVRLAIKKAPKWISCALWGLVALKLLLPFHIESVLSLVPSSAPIPEDIVYSEVPHIEAGIPAVDHVVNPIIETNLALQPVAPVNPMQIVISVCAVLWVAGIVILLAYLGVSYLLLRKRVAASEKIPGETDSVQAYGKAYRGSNRSMRSGSARKHVDAYICDEITGPFILGVVHPKIYLPSGLSEETLECVLEHEKTHIKRLDHLWKPLGYLILTVYWFNPLCWISYILLCKDIELACDEKVTKDRDNEWKAVYCQALLDCSIQRKMITACPVAFGEVGIKDRIKSVLHYRKPAFWIIAAALAASVIVAVCFVTNPKSKNDRASELTLEKLAELCGSETWEEDQRTQGISYWEKFENVQAQRHADETMSPESEPFQETDSDADADSLSELYTCRLENESGTYELQISCWTEAAEETSGVAKGAIERILLYRVEKDDGILLYAEDEKWATNKNVSEFLTKKYNNSPDMFRNLPIAFDENGELHTETVPRIALGDYRADLFLNFAGCLFESESYEEPHHGEDAPEAWYALGGVGICMDPNVSESALFSDGKLIAYDYTDNHMSCEKITDLEGGNYTGCLYRYEMDLFTAPEMIDLQPGIPTTASCWAAFLTEGPEAPLYVVFFNCSYFTRREMMACIGMASSEYSDGPDEIIAEGRFDNVMGYAGYYVFYDGHPTFGYYYADDGTLLAQVWGTRPEDVGIVDLDMDGENELVAQLVWGDGGMDVVVYKKFLKGIREAFCSDLLEYEYDNVGLGSLSVEYLKVTNEVKISYYVQKEDETREAVYQIWNDDLCWRAPEWVADAGDPSDEEHSSFWGDQRDWPFGYVTEVAPGVGNMLEMTVSLQYFVHQDDTELVEKLGLTKDEAEDDFPSGIAIEPVGDTRIYNLSEDCEYILLDDQHMFENDDRVEKYDDGHIVTKDVAVFLEYIGMEGVLNTEDEWYGVHHAARNCRLFFYDIQDGVIKSIYETWLP